MRVGFVTQLNWRRYGAFWTGLVAGVGLEPCFASPEAIRSALADQSVAEVPSVPFRLAAAQAVALRDCDLLVVPQLVPESEVARGAGQDPWIADFPGALRSQVGGLANMRSVPSWFDAELESLVVEFLQPIVRDPAAVKRALARVMPESRRPAKAAPPLVLGGTQRSVGLIGQPWLVSDKLVELVAQPGDHVVSQHQFAPQELRAEGLRADQRLVDSDAEVIGAARLLGRRAGIAVVKLVVDEESPSDGWLVSRVTKASSRSVEIVSLQELLAERDLVDTLALG